ncbi:MAG: family 10 glycosylhydrolase [Bacteroidia bacterium]|nr:family 10 glycosylhydrolase [Bacteroidia bacterium]
MSRIRKIISLLTAVLLSTSMYAQQLPKREFRGAWLHIVGNSEMKSMEQGEIRDWLSSTLDDLKAAGCNAVFFQVRPQADAFYISGLEPWTRYLTGVQGKAPDPLWDPLQFMVEQCHVRGMELHAWLNPYRVTSTAKDELAEGHIYKRKPELFKRYGSQIYFDPGEPESREHVVAVVRDIVERYDVDGIHFDDYFYPYPENGKDFPDNDTFTEYGPSQGFGKGRKDDWRRHNTAQLIHEVNEAVKSIKPWVRFGVSPFGIHRNAGDTPDGSGSATNGLSCYHQLYADAPGWAKAGDVDYLAPQLYWKIGHKLADYEVLVKWWNAQNLPGHIYIGQSIETLGEPDLKDKSKTQLERKMELTRTLPGISGNVWWPGWSISSNAVGIADSLSRTFQKHIALLPAYTDIDSIAPEPVKDVWYRRSKGLIRWEVEPTDDPLQEVHFFVIYRFGEYANDDFDDPANIFAVTRDNWFTPPGAGRYAVTVVDRCWNESAPSDIITIF